MKYLMKLESFVENKTYLKIYENFEKKVSINLLDLCEYSGGMYYAIELLFKLTKNCSSYTVEFFDAKHENPPFKHYQFPGENSFKENEKDDEGICCHHAIFSYGYLRSSVAAAANLSVIFTLYDINLDDDLLIFLDAKKYNL